VVIGAFRIGQIKVGQSGETVVLAVADGPHLRVVGDFSKVPAFWDFHRQASGPRWRSGLLRYLSDSDAEKLLKALEEVAVAVA